MGRPNYTSARHHVPILLEWRLTRLQQRKIEGVKLGQAVAKDLLKRLPPGAGSKAALRDPVIELDVTGKALGEEGLIEVVAALQRAMEYAGDQGKVVKLEELCLRDNQLDITCLTAVSHVLELGADDLSDLDLSYNLISVDSDDNAEIFEDFLRGLAGCCVLRRLDLSGNSLGPRAFELFTKVYGQEPAIDLVTAGEQMRPHATNGQGTPDSIRKVSKGTSLSRRLKDVSIDSPTNEEIGKTLLARYRRTQGLRSIPYIALSETSMTETCALHLSCLVQLHGYPEQLLEYVPPAKAGASAQQLAAYDNETCQGIIYLPNPQLGIAGTKVLQLAEVVRRSSQEYLDGESVEASPAPLRQPSSARRVSDTRSSPLPSGHRGRSATATRHTDYEDGGISSAMSELDRARHRIEINTFRDAGLLSNDLWRTALKMLCLGRALCSGKEAEKTEPEPRKVEQSLPEQQMTVEEKLDLASDPAQASSRPTRASSIATPRPNPLGHRSPNQPLTLRLGQEWRNGKLELTPIPPNPSSKQAPEALTPSDSNSPTSPPRPLSPPPSAPEIPQKVYRTDLPCGFSHDIWRRIAAYVVDKKGVMSVSQHDTAMRWAMDYRTLITELESLGKPRSAQIWRVLDGMHCLTYEMRS